MDCGYSARRCHFEFAWITLCSWVDVKNNEKNKILAGSSGPYEQSEHIERFCVNKVSSQIIQSIQTSFFVQWEWNLSCLIEVLWNLAFNLKK